MAVVRASLVWCGVGLPVRRRQASWWEPCRAALSSENRLARSHAALGLAQTRCLVHHSPAAAAAHHLFTDLTSHHLCVLRSIGLGWVRRTIALTDSNASDPKYLQPPKLPPLCPPPVSPLPHLRSRSRETSQSTVVILVLRFCFCPVVTELCAQFWEVVARIRRSEPDLDTDRHS